MRLVDTPSALEQAAEQLRGSTRLYLDTEFESSRDGMTMCLLQISAGQEIYVIDTLRLEKLAPLGPILAARNVEWVLHAGQQDVPLIANRLGLRELPEIFDTQLAWSLLGPEYSVSLAYLEYRVLGVRGMKTHQTDDWSRRPLPAAQLDYAARDVMRLPELRHELGRRLAALGREQLVSRAARELLDPEVEPPPLLGLDSFRNAWQLDPPSQAALRHLIGWYNGLDAAERTAAPEPKALLSIATRLPETLDDLTRIKGVPRRWSARIGQAWLSSLLRAAAHTSVEDFVPIEPQPYATSLDIQLDAWLTALRAELCSKLELAPELALPARIVRKMRLLILESGAAESGVLALTGWRSELLGAGFAEYCQAHPAPLAEPPAPESLPMEQETRARLSHGLRSPLSAMSSALALLKRSDHPAATARWLSIIDRQLSVLVGLVDEHFRSEAPSVPPQPRVPHTYVQRSESAPPPAAGLRVLVVDDNVDAASTLAELVTAWGHQAAVAYEAESALDLAGRFEPEVVVLDIGLPGMDGYELARRLRAGGSKASMIALTGYGEKADRERAKTAGFELHIVKPVDASVLKTAINARAAKS